MFPMNAGGIVISLHIAPTGAAATRPVGEVRAVAGRGLEGDRYFNQLGTYSNDPGTGRHVTLIEIEAIEALKRDYDIDMAAGCSRRNIVTRLCDPCSHLEKLTCQGVLRGLIHRGGLRAEIVRGGTIRIGDEIVAYR
jgi:MOSC domain-containing protein YiiM